MLLENEFVRLRALEPEDLDLLYKWENDTQLWKYGSTLNPYSRFVLHKYLENSHLNIYEAGQLRLMIVDKSSDKTVGTIDIYDFDPYHNRAGVGILIDSEYRGKGLANNSLLLVLDYTINYLKLEQIYAFIPSKNLPSLNLFRKSGFIETANLKRWNKTIEGYTDVYVYQFISCT